MRLRRLMALACFAGLSGLADEPGHAPSGNVSIRGPAGASEIVISTTNRLAGAIHSLTWNGREFIDSHDHGRQLQSAASFDCAASDEFWAERYNPTEAGSRRDGVGATSSSRLLSSTAAGPELRTTTQLAFWLAPGETSFGRPAINQTVLSEHRLAKRVHIGHNTLDHAIEYEVTFTIPPGERHTYAQFEALTGYMPPEFSRFWTFRPDSGTLKELDDGPGEQPFPVVVATQDGSYAMGVYSPNRPSPDGQQAGYGRFRFEEEQVVKWNCVFRLRDAQGIREGDHQFRMFVAVGTLEDVRATLQSLVHEFPCRQTSRAVAR